MPSSTPKALDHYPAGWLKVMAEAFASPDTPQPFPLALDADASSACSVETTHRKLRAFTRAYTVQTGYAPAITAGLAAGGRFAFKRQLEGQPGIGRIWAFTVTWMPFGRRSAELIEKALSGVDSGGGAR